LDDRELYKKTLGEAVSGQWKIATGTVGAK